MTLDQRANRFLQTNCSSALSTDTIGNDPAPTHDQLSQRIRRCSCIGKEFGMTPKSSAIGLMLCLTLLCFAGTRSSFAKQPPAGGDGSSLVGTWTLVSVEAHWPDGHVTAPWGAHPPGRLIYTQDGLMLVLCMHARRNQATQDAVPPALQNEAAGYFGKYKVDSTRHIVSHAVVATLRHAESGIIERAYEFRNGELYLTARATHDGRPVTYVLVWTRA